MEALGLKEILPVLFTWSIGKQSGFETPCIDYKAYTKLPNAARMSGMVYVKTGWNSDRGIAHYQTGRVFAESI